MDRLIVTSRKFVLASVLSFLLLVTVLAICISLFPNNEDISYAYVVYPEYYNEIASLDNDNAIEVILFETAEKQHIGYDRLLRWGILRKPDNQIPGTDPGTPEILKKYKSLYLGDPAKKTVYLTFDEGYEAGYTAAILDILRENDVKAAFFITGHYLKKEKALVKRMVEEGHTVGNHTVNHKCLPMLSDEEIEAEVMGLDRLFHKEFGIHMVFLRPPKGEYSQRSLDITNKYGLKNVFWSFAYDDWYREKTRGAGYAHDIVMRNMHNGAIILLHAVSQDNAEALGSIISDIRAMGYDFGRLEDIRTDTER